MNDPRQSPPYLSGTCRLASSPKVKAEAQAVEVNRTWFAWIPLPRGMKVLETGATGRAQLHVLRVQFAGETVEVQSSVPKLNKGQSGLRDEQSLKLDHGRKS